MSYQSFRTLNYLLFALVLFQGSSGLRDVYMVIPEAVERGKPVVIQCMYDLEKDDLYQVKWYRGDREFCRYSPRDVPPLKIFPIPGIEVDRERTDTKQLTIKSATRTVHGRYTCEVSADAPSFITAQVHGSMYVVDLPKTDLDLIGLKSHYKPGMKLKVECICHNSMPPANLSFFVNSERALSQHVWHRVSGGKNGSLWTAYSTIQFTVQRHHFLRGKIKIRCVAFIYSIYYRSHEQVADEIKPKPTSAPFTETRIVRVNKVNRVADNRSTCLFENNLKLLIIVLIFSHLPYRNVSR